MLPVCSSACRVPSTALRTTSGEPDTRWLTLDELVEADCSREEFNEFCATYVKMLQETMKKDAKRFKSVS